MKKQLHTVIVSGNRIVDVYARIRSDIINQKPDVIPLQEDFGKLQENLPVGYLLGDGVHPTYAGHGPKDVDGTASFFFCAFLRYQ